MFGWIEKSKSCLQKFLLEGKKTATIVGEMFVNHFFVFYNCLKAQLSPKVNVQDFKVK